MNDSLLLWLVGGVAVALGLVLVLGAGAPAPEPVVAAPEGEVVAESVGTEATKTAYWEPVSGATSVTRTAVPCSVCGRHQAVIVEETPKLVGGCFPPDTPCGRHDCPICPRLSRPRAELVPVEVVVECTAAFPCGQPGCPICARPTVVCSPEPCAPVCAPVCPTKPRINRNVPGCIDECAFFQLNATVPQPVCAPICYRWAASRGTLVNATARDPIYFAPEVHLSCGEDVLITLTVVDAYGARYTDEIRLHVRNVP